MNRIKDRETHKRAFAWPVKAWYGSPEDKEVNFGMYADGGGTSGEMTMEWVSLNNRQVPRLIAFDGSWKVLASFGDLLQRLGEVDNKLITQEQFVEILLSCGFQDRTPYQRPYRDQNV